MEYPSGASVRKQLTLSDVQDRLVVTTDMAAIMPRADPERHIPIRVMDSWGDRHQFYLYRRRGTYGKPVFRAREWRAFIRSRGAKEGDVIYFSYEVNEMRRTEYRIVLEFQNLFPAHPGDL